MMEEGEIQELELNEEDEKYDSLIDRLRVNVQQSEEARKFFNSDAGTAILDFIKEAKNEAQSIGMGDDEEVGKLARQEFKVLVKVESFFATLLISGDEAHKQLRINDELDLEGDDNEY